MGVFASAGSLILMIGLVRAINTYIKNTKRNIQMTHINNPIKMVIRVPVSPKARSNSESEIL